MFSQAVPPPNQMPITSLRVAQQLIGLLDEQTIADKTGLSLEEVRGLIPH